MSELLGFSGWLGPEVDLSSAARSEEKSQKKLEKRSRGTITEVVIVGDDVCGTGSHAFMSH